MDKDSAEQAPQYDIIVAGGGAAGMLASAVAAQQGARVLLLEKNEHTGRKLSITGKGRCNITNNCAVSDVIENVPTGGSFLQGALNGFTPRDTMAMFESLGVPLKTERGGRVFPQSDKASDVVKALRLYIDRSGASFQRRKVDALLVENGQITGVSTTGGTITCKAAILATGGISYPATGSTGDGYKMASALGHTITPLRGSLVPLMADPESCAKMQGLTLKNVRIYVFDGVKRHIYEDFGELLFTHFGISGPLALSASAHMRDFEGKKYHIIVDIKPGLDEKKLDLRILRDFARYPNRNFTNSLGDLLSKSMIPVIIEKSGIPPETKVNSINREQRLKLAGLLKAYRIDVLGPGPIEEAIVTSGGVKLNEVNPKTMESKLVHGLFFAGEVLDVDAYTGGFNLQIAWSTAYAAGRAAANRNS